MIPRTCCAKPIAIGLVMEPNAIGSVSMRHDPYRWKSSLVMKGEVVTHQLDCAVAGSAASALTSPAFVAAMSVFCHSFAWLPSVSQIIRYLVKARLVGRALGG